MPVIICYIIGHRKDVPLWYSTLKCYLPIWIEGTIMHCNDFITVIRYNTHSKHNLYSYRPFTFNFEILHAIGNVQIQKRIYINYILAKDNYAGGIIVLWQYINMNIKFCDVEIGSCMGTSLPFIYHNRGFIANSSFAKLVLIANMLSTYSVCES